MIKYIFDSDKDNNYFKDNIYISYDSNISNQKSISVKDNICVKNFKCTAGSRILKDFYPKYDATVISRLKNTGYVIKGKTNLDEFAIGSTGLNSGFGYTYNSINSEYITGGSSSGSALSVAKNLTDIALGSDTGGSVRLPAAFNNLIGFKPTYGALSRYGLIAFASSLDTIGFISKNIYNIIETFNISKGIDENDFTTINIKEKDSVKKPKIAFIDINDNLLSEEILQSYNLFKLFLNQKYFIKSKKLKYLKYWLSVYLIISSSEASSNLKRYDNKLFGNKNIKSVSFKNDFNNIRNQLFGTEVKRRIMLGTFVLSKGFKDKYFKKAEKIRKLIISEFNSVFDDFDFLIMPTSPNFPIKISETQNLLNNYKLDYFTIGASLAGLPAITIPYGKSYNGFKTGIQIIADKGNDENLLEFANKINQSFV